MDAGLCAECFWARWVNSKRGPTYLRCARAEVDTTFEKYPALPKQDCQGFDPRIDRPVDGTGDAGSEPG